MAQQKTAYQQLLEDDTATLSSNCSWLIVQYEEKAVLDMIRQNSGLYVYRDQWSRQEVMEQQTSFNIFNAMASAKLERPVISLEQDERAILKAIAGSGVMSAEHMQGVLITASFAGGRGEFVTDCPPEIQGFVCDMLQKLYKAHVSADYETYMASLKGLAIRCHEACTGAQKAQMTQRLYAGARWGNESDIEAHENLSFTDEEKNGFLLGMLEGRAVFYKTPQSVCVIAGSSSGKTTCLAVPTILWANNSAVILDVKKAEDPEHNELFYLTAGKRIQDGHKVIVWNPLSEQTHSYNPLSVVRSDPLYLWSDAQEVAFSLIEESTGENAQFFTGASRRVLALWIAVCKLDDPQTHLGKVIDQLSLPSDEVLIKCEILVPDMVQYALKDREDKEALQPLLNAANRIRAMISEAGRTYENVLETCITQLAIFESPLVRRSIMHSDWKPEDLRTGKTTVYLTINDSREAGQWAPLLRVILAQHFSRLRNHSTGTNKDIIDFILDEASIMENFPALLSSLDRGRTYGVRKMLLYQSIDQITKIFERPGSIFDNVGGDIYLSPKGQTAKALSEELGVKESILEGKPEPLARPEELSGTTYAEKLIFNAGKSNPFQLDKLPYYKYMNELVQPVPTIIYPDRSKK